MAKFKHNEQTLLVLNDLINRVQQLVEASEVNRHRLGDERTDQEIQSFNAVLTLIEQVKKTGHVFRGNEFFPDALLPYTTIPSFNNPLKVEKSEV